MISKDGTYIVCDHLGCDERIKNHRWGKTTAIGWYFAKTGDKALCPDHVPEWFDRWRRRKAGDPSA